MTYTPEQLKEKYNSIPEDLRDALFSTENADIIQKIGEKYNLTAGKIADLADETGLVMLGFTPVKDFISNLAKRLEIGIDIAGKIGQDINEQIFGKYRESLRKIHGLVEEKEEEIKKEDVLKEIEKPEELPQKLSFMEKMKADIFKVKPKESEHGNYQGQDPYREPVE